MAKQIKNTTVTLYTADQQTIKSAALSLERDFNKDQLLHKVNAINDCIAGSNVVLMAENDDSIVHNRIYDTFTGPSPKKKIYQMSKSECAEFVAVFNSVPNNYQLIIDTLPPKALELALYIARHGVASGDSAKKICGSDVLLKKRSWSRDSYELSQPYKMFNIWRDLEYVSHYGYYTSRPSEAFVSIPDEWQTLLIPRVFPLSSETVESRMQNNPGKGRIVSNLNNIPHIVKVLQTMARTGSIEAGSNKLLTKTTHRRIADTVKFPDIYGSDFPDYYNSSLVTFFALGFIVNLIYRTSSSKSPAQEAKADAADTIRSTFSKIKAIGNEPQLLSEIIPGISKITRSSLSATSVTLYISQLTNLIFNNLSWKSLSDLDHKICMLNSQYDNLAFFKTCEFSTQPWIDDRTKTSISPENARERITFPFIRGLMQFFLSIGCVEVYAEPQDIEKSSFSGILFVRPTALGMYAAKMGDKPELDDNDEFIRQYELIDRPLLVISKKEGNPYDTWLSKIAKKQGNRWIVTPDSFMKDCSTLSDIQEFEKDFKKFICKDLSPIWSDFFKRMKGNIGPGVGSILGKTFTVFNINPDNKELLDYIARTPKISKLAFKAEGFKLVVSRQHTDTFIDLLKAGGFIIEQ